MNTLNPKIEFFVGYFRWISPLTTYFWVAFIIIAIFIIFNKKLSTDLKKLFLDGFLYVGFALFVSYVLFAIYAHTDALHMANALGGLTPIQKAYYFHLFRSFLACRTSWIVLFISIGLFERFSLLPYIIKKEEKHIKINPADASTRR